MRGNCRVILAFEIVYWIVWGTLIARTMITSYMNVKFSRDLRKTNRQFFMVFNESFVNVRSTLEENKLEDENRKKANRLSAFYRYYAD